MHLMTNVVEGYTVGLIDTIWPIIFVVIITYTIFVFRVRIRETKARVFIPYLFLVLMIIFEVSVFANVITIPFKPLKDTLQNLPLHLCATSAMLIILYLSTKKPILLEILFLQGIIGALVTFIFPSTTSYPYEYDYWRFFFSHTLLFLVPMYYYIVEGFRPNKRTLVIAFIAAHIFAAIAIGVNFIADYEYMYLNADNESNLFHFIPIHNTIPFLGIWPGVILFGEMLIFPIYFTVYALFQFIERFASKEVLIVNKKTT